MLRRPRRPPLRRPPSGAASTETLVVAGILVTILVLLIGGFRTYLRVGIVNVAAKISCAIDKGGAGCQTGAPAAAGAAAPGVNPGTGLVGAPAGGAGAGGGAGGGGVTTGLGANVDRWVNSSPEFARLVRDFLSRGGTIVIGPAGGGSSYSDRLDQITIDANDIARGNTADIAGTLSHEGGHSNHTPGYTPPDGLTRAEYIRVNVERQLAGEGEAILRNFEMRDSVVNYGGGLTHVRGPLAEYERIYEQYLVDGDRDKARAAIGAIVANQRVSIPPKEKYWDYYARTYADFWDATHPPGGAA